MTAIRATIPQRKKEEAKTLPTRQHVFLPCFDVLLFLLLISAPVRVAVQPSDGSTWSLLDATFSFWPSVAMVVGIFTVMFSVTFLLLVYVKFFRFTVVELSRNEGFLLPQCRFSGINKAAVESLLVFWFSGLRDAWDGLECIVCLFRFDGAELLRLLPRCKHAFHIDCIDRWLAAHSTCPPCRRKVNAEDDNAVFEYFTSSRFLFASCRHEEAVNDVDRVGRSFRKINIPDEGTNRAQA